MPKQLVNLNLNVDIATLVTPKINLFKITTLILEAADYAEAYAKQYTTCPATLNAIFITHFVMLYNNVINN